MTDKRTKADLLDEIERLKEAVKSKTTHIAKLNEDNRLIEDRADHYMKEAGRLSAYAGDLIRRMEKDRDRFGETLEASRAAISGITQIFNTRPPEREVDPANEDWILGRLAPHQKEVRPFERAPF